MPVHEPTTNGSLSSEPVEILVDPTLAPRTNSFRKTEPDIDVR